MVTGVSVCRARGFGSCRTHPLQRSFRRTSTLVSLLVRNHQRADWPIAPFFGGRPFPSLCDVTCRGLGGNRICDCRRDCHLVQHQCDQVQSRRRHVWMRSTLTVVLPMAHGLPWPVVLYPWGEIRRRRARDHPLPRRPTASQRAFRRGLLCGHADASCGWGSGRGSRGSLGSSIWAWRLCCSWASAPR